MCVCVCVCVCVWVLTEKSINHILRSIGELDTIASLLVHEPNFCSHTDGCEYSMHSWSEGSQKPTCLMRKSLHTSRQTPHLYSNAVWIEMLELLQNTQSHWCYTWLWILALQHSLLFLSSMLPNAPSSLFCTSKRGIHYNDCVCLHIAFLALIKGRSKRTYVHIRVGWAQQKQLLCQAARTRLPSSICHLLLN